MALDSMHSPCMAVGLAVNHLPPRVHDSQQVKDKRVSLQTDPTPSALRLKNGSFLGSKLIHINSDGPRPATHTHAPKHPTSLGHSHHAHPLTYHPKLWSGNGKPRTDLEQLVLRTHFRWDGELCSNSNPPKDYTNMEPSDANSKPAYEARPTTPPKPLPQTPISCLSTSIGAPLSSQTRRTWASPVRQRSTPTSSSSADSQDLLPAAIFRFLDRGEINIAMREEEPNLYIVMFSNRCLPFVVFNTH